MSAAMSPPQRLRARMAEALGLNAAQVLPVRDAAHGIGLFFRRAARDGSRSVAAPEDGVNQRLAAICGLELSASAEVRLVRSLPEGPWRTGGALLVDETEAELVETSLSDEIGAFEGLVVLRAVGAVAALVAAPEQIAALEEVLEPFALPQVLIAAAETELTPARLVLADARCALLRSERDRLMALLRPFAEVRAGDGASLVVKPADRGAAERAMRRLGVAFESAPDGLRVSLGDPAANDRIAAAFGARVARPRRWGEVVRDTKETRIGCAVDLDVVEVRARTGLGFYDHMLEQVAFHGGFGLTLVCDGDLEIDAHHTVEDCAIAFGQALKAALGERRGVARFGFVLPMDEAEAKVSVDLGGRPFSVFDGAFRGSHIGDYPTEMTAHVFRSLAESLGAAIHVSVAGDNDHHKTEACFKALGRALRQAVAIEGAGIPSTKGVI